MLNVGVTLFKMTLKKISLNTEGKSSVLLSKFNDMLNCLVVINFVGCFYVLQKYKVLRM